MDALSGAWFSLKLIGGRYSAVQPCLWSFRSIVSSVTSTGLILQRPGWSCSVLSCRMSQMSPDILKAGQERFDVTDNNNRHRKSSFPHLVLQRRCILVRVPHGVKDVTVSGVWTASRVKSSNSLSEHPLIHADVPTCSETSHNSSSKNCLWCIHGAKHRKLYSRRLLRKTKSNWEVWKNKISINRSFIDGCVFRSVVFH